MVYLFVSFRMDAVAQGRQDLCAAYLASAYCSQMFFVYRRSCGTPRHTAILLSIVEGALLCISYLISSCGPVCILQLCHDILKCFIPIGFLAFLV